MTKEARVPAAHLLATSGQEQEGDQVDQVKRLVVEEAVFRIYCQFHPFKVMNMLVIRLHTILITTCIFKVKV